MEEHRFSQYKTIQMIFLHHMHIGLGDMQSYKIPRIFQNNSRKTNCGTGLTHNPILQLQGRASEIYSQQYQQHRLVPPPRSANSQLTFYYHRTTESAAKSTLAASDDEHSHRTILIHTPLVIPNVKIQCKNTSLCSS